MGDRRGMTLREVLVVVGVMGLMVGIAALWLVLGVQRNRAAAMNATCASNLKGISADFDIYAAQHRDSLPVVPGAADAVWLADQTRDFAGILLGPTPAPMSAVKKGFYCPANSLQDPDTMWEHGKVSVWGYALFNDRGGDAVGMPATFPARTPALGYHKKLTVMSNPAETELALDVIVSESDKGGGANFSKVTGGAPPAITFASSHLAGEKPEGAHVAAFDGHVEWRMFEAAKAVAVKQGGATPAFMWVPNP